MDCRLISPASDAKMRLIMKQVLEHRTTSKEVRADFLEGLLKLREKYGDIGEKDTFITESFHVKLAKIKQKCHDGSGI
jgi:hypothetical protein